MKKPLFKLRTLFIAFYLQFTLWLICQAFIYGYKAGYVECGNECVKVINSIDSEIKARLKR